MKSLKMTAVIAAILPFIAMTAPAQAAVTQLFDWSLSGPAASLGGVPLPESGELMATETGVGVWKVDALTLAGGKANSLIDFDGSDDLIYTNGFASLDPKGLAFESAAGQSVDIFSFFSQGTPPTGNAYGESANPGGFGVGTFKLTAVSAAPEPSIWLLLVAGVGGVGLMMRGVQTDAGSKRKTTLAA